MKEFHLVIYGAEKESVHPAIQELATSMQFEDYDVEKMLEPLAKTPSVILCYSPSAKAGIAAIEIAQALRCNYPDLPMFFIALNKQDFEKKNLIKNGFTQVYLLPWEKSDLIKSMNHELIYSMIPELRDYKPVKVVDLVPGAELDFSLKIYLPVNNKFLPFSAAGAPISEEKIQKLVQNNMGTLFIRNDEIANFERYTKDILKKILKSNTMSETERQAKLEKCVRDLVSDMFVDNIKENTFGKSQTLLNEVKAIIELMISDNDKGLLQKIGNLVNQEKNFYLHFSNVSTYAGLFAIALGIEKPDMVALAGLLHDIGKINLPQEIADIDDDEISNLGPHALEAYKKHPSFALDIIKMKKMVISPETAKAILHHHEALNGTGYPEGLEGGRISKEGRILAIANEFDSLTTMKQGKKKLTPLEALNFMITENSKDPGRMVLDLDMLKKFKQILTGDL